MPISQTKPYIWDLIYKTCSHTLACHTSPCYEQVGAVGFASHRRRAGSERPLGRLRHFSVEMNLFRLL